MSVVRAILATGMLCVLIAGCSPSGVEHARSEGPPSLIAREELFGNPEKAAVQLSPDGTQVSYLAPVDGVLNVWVGPLDDLDAATPVTQDDKRGIRRYFWAYTNKHIIYLQDIGGDENWRAYSVDVTSGKIVDLTPWEGVQAQIVQVSHRQPGQIMVGVNNRDPRLHDLYVIDIASGERELVEENPGYAAWIADDDYAARLAMMNTPDGGWQLYRKSLSGEWKEWSEIPSDDALTTQPAGFDKSGDVVYMLDSRGRNTAALYALNLKTDEKTLLFEDERADVDAVMTHPTENTIQAAAATFARREWKILDDTIREDLAYLATVTDGELEVNSRTLDDQKWIVGYELSDRPYSYYLYDRKAREATLLFTSRPALKDETLARMHAVVIKSRDNLDLVSYLTLPVESDPDGDGRPDEALPMVLFVHGGPWARDNWGYNPYHQWLANRGYAVLSVNYRGSTGMGKEFINASTHEWAGKMHDDLIDAVEWAVNEGIADREQVAIAGGSYGGYATLVGLTFTPETFACGVDIVGPSNLMTLIESIPPYWKPVLDLFTARVGDHRTEAGRQLLAERSPLTHASAITKPLLIGQGANDPRVKQQESDQIVEAMQANEIPVTYVLFPDEGHGFARPENNLAFNAVAEAFLSECLGGRVEPLGDDLSGSTIMVPAGAGDIAGLPEALDAEGGSGASPDAGTTAGS